ncbi:carboxypeptidase-like regulatory domain-containing protein [Flavobacterium zepuense]|uniref:Carboxypeptidase-like regulatory domain-containing protein n=1 Tax=Flavobacterium zepuense TaxID=2593302 RepID=A0A552V5V0_9FLAO|nr:carboxypeptidase-like regulatory domain-containing protein [Flavobacterium zepuense]TRW25843.1 carboxypeptidase-like regulatory domain-containing protein [Flavobacterium zepuense]
MKLTLQYFVILFMCCNSLFAQTSAIIKDKTTNQPVPYVNIWVDGKNIGTTANENGSFNLPALADDAMLVLSAIGYETLQVSALNLPQYILLSPAAIELQEVVIGKKNNIEACTGKFSQADIYRYFAC